MMNTKHKKYGSLINYRMLWLLVAFTGCISKDDYGESITVRRLEAIEIYSDSTYDWIAEFSPLDDYKLVRHTLNHSPERSELWYYLLKNGETISCFQAENIYFMSDVDIDDVPPHLKPLDYLHSVKVGPNQAIIMFEKGDCLYLFARENLTKNPYLYIMTENVNEKLLLEPQVYFCFRTI
jgi:hypothetical protein